MIDRSPITNCWGQVRPVAIKTEHLPVFRGYEGAAYNHHPQIISLRGRLYASWSCGYIHEDDPGQWMAMATSDDGGETWSEPLRISPYGAGQVAEITCTAEGIRTHEGRLIAYYGRHEWAPLGLDEAGHRLLDACSRYAEDPGTWVHRDVWTEARVSSDGGRTWSEPEKVIDRFVPNLRPFPVAAGHAGQRLICPGNIAYPFTDDPAGLSGWTFTGLPRLPENVVDDPEGFHKACRHRGDKMDDGRPLELCEGSFYQTGDGVIHMMLRTNQHLLAVTESHDGGETWSEPMLTGYSDCRCRFHFGRLPDGRYLGVSCPQPRSGRTPMVLATSDDGIAFDRHYILGNEPAARSRMPGRHKSGRYGYPSYHLVDDTMYVIYTINKEDVAVCRFSMSELA